MAPRKKDKAKTAARKHKRAGKDVLRELYKLCPEAGGEAGVKENGKEMFICSPKVFSLPESIGTLDGLQILNLSECPQLLELPESIGELKALTVLDLERCTSLNSLPDSIGGMSALTSLDLTACTSLVALPATISGLGALTTLNLPACSTLTALPNAIGGLGALTDLDLRECSSLVALPDAIGGLKALTDLYLIDCLNLVALPGAIGELKALTKLYLMGCSSLTELPATIGELGALTELWLTGCTSLTALPDAIGGLGALTTLDLSDCSSLAALPESIGRRSSPLTLKLRDCTSLVALPDTLVEPGSNVLVLGWNQTTVTSTTLTRASVITVPGVTPATDADEAADETMEDLHLLRRKRDEWAVQDQPEEEQKAEFDRKFLEEIKAKLSDAQMLYLRRLRRRVCDACGRQGTLEVERFPVCYCGARRYCDEKCQRVDWDRGHSANCASGHTFPQSALDTMREIPQRPNKESHKVIRDWAYEMFPPPADRPR